MIFYKLGNKNEIIKEGKVELPNRYRGISQGSALSQFFANVYLKEFDLFMKKLYGDRFIRYIDDFIVICSTKNEAEEAKNKATKFLERRSLTLSPSLDKTKIVDIREEDFNFLGLNFSNKRIGWKRKGKKARKWILEVLDTSNMEYYKNCNFPEKIIKINQKFEGLEEYIKYYHVEQDFDFINKHIIDKKRKKVYKNIKLLDKKKIKHIIPLTKWELLFKN